MRIFSPTPAPSPQLDVPVPSNTSILSFPGLSRGDPLPTPCLIDFYEPGPDVEAAVPELIAKVNHPDMEVRLAGANELAWVRDEFNVVLAINALLAQKLDPHLLFQKVVIETLASYTELNNPAVETKLSMIARYFCNQMERAHRIDTGIFGSALDALVSLCRRDNIYVLFLRKFLDSKRYDGLLISRVALGAAELGEHAASLTDSLAKLHNHRLPNVRVFARAALTAIHTPEALAALENFRADGVIVRRLVST